MDEFDFFDEEPRIKNHREIQELFRELEEVEKIVEHPELIEKTEIHPGDARETPEIIERPSSKEKTIRKEEKKKHRIVFARKRTKKPKVPEVRIEHKAKHTLRSRRPKVPTIQEERAHIFSLRLHKNQQHIGELRIGDHPAVHIPQSTFTLRIDSEGNVIGFPLKSSKPDLIEKEHRRRLRIPFRKKHSNEPEELPTEETPKGFKAKIKKIIPHRGKSKKESETDEAGTSGGKSKLKGMLSRKRKSKEEKE